MTFSLIPPDGTHTTSETNWRNLQQTISTGGFKPQPASGGPTITGTGLTVQGYYTQAVTGIVFFSITMTTTSGTVNLVWNNLQYLILPKPMTLLGVANGGYPSTVIPVCAPIASLQPNLVSLVNQGRNAVLINNGANFTIAAQTITIQGFYFTGK